MFGTLADFDALIERAHELGLRVMIDLVLSHTSDQHRWFRESRSSRDNPKADWYVWADAKPDGTAPNNWLSIFGGAGWEWDSERLQYYQHNFLKEQPDLNFHNEEVVAELLGGGALLAGAGGGRVPARHDQLLLLRPGAPRQPGAAGGSAGLFHRAGGEPLQLAGASLRQEPAGDGPVPQAVPRGDERVRRHRGGGRGGRRPARHGDHGGIYPRRRPHADVLRLRVPLAGRAERAAGGAGAAPVRAGGLGRLGLLGLLEPRRRAARDALAHGRGAAPGLPRAHAQLARVGLPLPGGGAGADRGLRAVRGAAGPLRQALLAEVPRAGRVPDADAVDERTTSMPASRTRSPGCRCRRSTCAWR